LGDTIYTSVDFNEKESVVDEVLELVLLYDAGRNDSVMHMLVLVLGSVTAFDAYRHEFCIGSRQDAVR
jgi:hypothetical protein